MFADDLIEDGSFTSDDAGYGFAVRLNWYRARRRKGWFRWMPEVPPALTISPGRFTRIAERKLQAPTPVRPCVE